MAAAGEELVELDLDRSGDSPRHDIRQLSLNELLEVFQDNFNASREVGLAA